MVSGNLNCNFIVLFPSDFQAVDRGFGIYIVNLSKKINAGRFLLNFNIVRFRATAYEGNSRENTSGKIKFSHNP